MSDEKVKPIRAMEPTEVTPEQVAMLAGLEVLKRRVISGEIEGMCVILNLTHSYENDIFGHYPDLELHFHAHELMIDLVDAAREDE